MDEAELVALGIAGTGAVIIGIAVRTQSWLVFIAAALRDRRLPRLLQGCAGWRHERDLRAARRKRYRPMAGPELAAVVCRLALRV